MEAGQRGSGAAGQDEFRRIQRACKLLGATRPTAVNLHWALRRMERRAEAVVGAGEPLQAALLAEANAIWDEDRAMCRRIGELGASLFPDGGTIATICNAGALATGGIGTALAPIYLLHERGVAVQTLVPETRPLLQGSRLTAWELHRAGVPVTLIGDGMIASRLRRGDVRGAGRGRPHCRERRRSQQDRYLWSGPGRPGSPGSVLRSCTELHGRSVHARGLLQSHRGAGCRRAHGLSGT